MKTRFRVLAAVLGTSAVLGLLPLLFGNPASEADGSSFTARQLSGAYMRWEAAHLESGGDERVVIGLGWSKGISVEPTLAVGSVTLDLLHGTISAEVHGLEDSTGADLWLVQNVEKPGRSFLPEPADVALRIGRLIPQDGSAVLRARLAPGVLQSFQPDLVVVTRAGELPTQPALLYGSPTLFQKLYTRDRLALARAQAGPGSGSLFHQRLLGEHLPARATDALSTLASLVSQGEQLFERETFGGNGRTCATCHPADNNFTIDPQFISRLAPNDPLFVAETNPALRQLERPQLLRRLGLILINPDGLEDPTHKFVVRSVPHLLALATSLQAAPPIDPASPTQRTDNTTVPPMQRTGWSGDGSPGGGSLHEFAIGAVVQHFTRRLDRVAGVDFRLPTPAELDALEAFQLSLGRQTDISLFETHLLDSAAAEGQEIFNSVGANPNVASGKCVQCHGEAGANIINFFPATGLSELNSNFINGTENIPDQEARRLEPNLPRDGGFGRAEQCDLDGDGHLDPGVFGNCSFNVPSLIEAADTGPFFHNNSATTLEDAIAFYSSDAFNNSPAARDTGPIHLTAEDNKKMAAFLRVLNALENIREALDYQSSAQSASSAAAARGQLLLAALQNEDAIKVLRASNLHADAAARLRIASTLLRLAADRLLPIDVAVQQATRLEQRARSAMIQQ
jgi:cytochrome c peroxidase